MRHKVSFHRVQVDVPAKVDQILLMIYPYVSEASLKKWTHPPLLPVYRLHESVEQDVYEF